MQYQIQWHFVRWLTMAISILSLISGARNISFHQILSPMITTSPKYSNPRGLSDGFTPPNEVSIIRQAWTGSLDIHFDDNKNHSTLKIVVSSLSRSLNLLNFTQLIFSNRINKSSFFCGYFNNIIQSTECLAIYS